VIKIVSGSFPMTTFTISLRQERMYGTIRHAGYIAIGKKNSCSETAIPAVTGLVGNPKSLLDK
jgi:hypothetical protein